MKYSSFAAFPAACAYIDIDCRREEKLEMACCEIQKHRTVRNVWKFLSHCTSVQLETQAVLQVDEEISNATGMHIPWSVRDEF